MRKVKRLYNYKLDHNVEMKRFGVVRQKENVSSWAMLHWLL